MARRRLVLAAVALLTVAGLGLAATAVDEQPSGGGGSASPVAGQSGPTGTGGEALLTLLFVLLVVAALASLAYRLYVNAWRRDLLYLAGAVVLAILALLAIEHLLHPVDSLAGNATRNGSMPEIRPGAPGTGTPGAGSSGVASPTGTLLALAAILVVGGLAAVFFSGGSTDEEADPDEEPTEDGDVAELGEAAGRAADELAESTLSNAVYRAWREMTDALDVRRPETTTPAQFADRAVAAGVDREDAETLTDLFREVRYGDAEATPEREQRARETLRRIEATYAEREEATSETTHECEGREGS